MKQDKGKKKAMVLRCEIKVSKSHEHSYVKTESQCKLLESHTVSTKSCLKIQKLYKLVCWKRVEIKPMNSIIPK